MYIVIKSDELQHHGVKGMRWGVRKDRNSSGLSRGARIARAVSPVGYALGTGVAKGIKKTSTTVKAGKRIRSAKNSYRNLTGSRKSAALKKYRSKNIDGMSDKDLQKAVNRMNLEKQYRSLTKVDFYRGKRSVDTMYNNATAMNRAVSAIPGGVKRKAFTKGAKAAATIASL